MGILRLLLFPFCLVYGFITWVRNKLFDWGILPSKSFNIPIIGLGNLSTGGTGKTPHVEYLVQLLKDQYRIAVLSRGYKRKTRGYLEAAKNATARDIGDEPLQIARKFPDALVVVCENRRKGIKRILKEHPEINLIILDDAFQNRYVKPGLNLLLTGYYKPFFRNFIMPCGNLREFKRGAMRADALVVTKTPNVFSPLDRRFFLGNLKPYYDKPNIFFSYLAYKDWLPLYKETPENTETSIKTIFLFTGIANTIALGEHLKRNSEELVVNKFPDHYQFKSSDLIRLRRQYNNKFSRSKIIIVTEKDAMRLQHPKLKEILKELPVYYIPVEVVFHDEDRENFEKLVFEFLSK